MTDPKTHYQWGYRYGPNLQWVEMRVDEAEARRAVGAYPELFVLIRRPLGEWEEVPENHPSQTGSDHG